MVHEALSAWPHGEKPGGTRRMCDQRRLVMVLLVLAPLGAAWSCPVPTTGSEYHVSPEGAPR